MRKREYVMNEQVRKAYDRFDALVAKRLLEIRLLILELAEQDDQIGAITETLKWGEPSYLTEQSKSGTTIRLSNVKDDTNYCGIYVHCQTRLISEFRDSFADVLEFSGNRAVLIDVNKPLEEIPVKMFLQKALTYHLKL
ncbi:MAG: DUF1801 domain-containing protein [Lentilitoribacter sp.]